MYRNCEPEKPIKKIRGRIFFQLNLKPSDEFSVLSAYSAIYPIHTRKMYRRKSKKITFLLYPSKMELRHSSWFRQEKRKILYMDSILKFYMFKSMTEFLILGVQSDASTRCLLALNVPIMEDILTMCEAIERQHVQSGEEMTLAKETHGARKVKAAEEVSHRHKVDPFNDEVFVKSTRDVETETLEIGPRDRTKGQDSLRTLEIGARDRTKGQDSLRTLVKGQSNWQEDVKFISYNSKFGNFVDDAGSVYMYTAQQIVPNDDAATDPSFYDGSSCNSSCDRDF